MTPSTKYIRVPIVRWVSDNNPGWVEAVLTDAEDKQWSFVAKIPMFTSDVDLDSQSDYPQPGVIVCEIIRETIDDNCKQLCLINIGKSLSNSGKSWGISSTNSTTQFWILKDQLEDQDPYDFD